MQSYAYALQEAGGKRQGLFQKRGTRPWQEVTAVAPSSFAAATVFDANGWRPPSMFLSKVEVDSMSSIFHAEDHSRLFPFVGCPPLMMTSTVSFMTLQDLEDVRIVNEEVEALLRTGAITGLSLPRLPLKHPQRPSGNQ